MSKAWQISCKGTRKTLDSEIELMFLSGLAWLVNIVHEWG